MKSIKLYYKCPGCQMDYWITPLEETILVCECSHPCTGCGTQIILRFENVFESSMQAWKPVEKGEKE